MSVAKRTPSRIGTIRSWATMTAEVGLEYFSFATRVPPPLPSPNKLGEGAGGDLCSLPRRRRTRARGAPCRHSAAGASSARVVRLFLVEDTPPGVARHPGCDTFAPAAALSSRQ